MGGNGGKNQIWFSCPNRRNKQVYLTPLKWIWPTIKQFYERKKKFFLIKFETPEKNNLGNSKEKKGLL